MKKILVLPFVVAVAMLSGCAVGPLVNHETARTVGNSNHELIAGYGEAGWVAKWNYGLGKDLDLGLQWETLSIGLRAKYAFINQSEGWSLAAALGAGASVGGSHYYGDLILSYLTGSWEPYGTFRFVHVTNDPTEFRTKDTDRINITIPGDVYDYGQAIVGTRYWLSSHWLLSAEASSLFAISSGLKIGNGVLIGGALGYRF